MVISQREIDEIGQKSVGGSLFYVLIRHGMTQLWVSILCSNVVPYSYLLRYISLCLIPYVRIILIHSITLVVLGFY